jgi:iron complex transport system substrate-binding protein
MNGHPIPRRRLAWLPLLTIICLSSLALACALLLAACGSDEGPTATTAASRTAFPVTVTDDLGTAVTITAEPARIVSTAPSNTQILFALGVGDRVVGVNSLDDYPPEVAGIAKVGDYQVNTEAVMALSPDLVVGYSGNEEGLAPIQAGGAAVLIFDPKSVAGIYSNIEAIGAATGTSAAAVALIDDVKTAVQEIADAAAATGDKPSVFYLVDNTLWTCGAGTFVDELLTLANADNAAAIPGDAATESYYQTNAERLVAADPEVIVLSGLAFTSIEEFTTDPRFTSLTAVKEGHVVLIEAEYDKLVTVPGPRIAEGLRALADAIHPGAF